MVESQAVLISKRSEAADFRTSPGTVYASTCNCGIQNEGLSKLAVRQKATSLRLADVLDDFRTLRSLLKTLRI